MSSIVTDTGVHICKLLSIYLFWFWLQFYLDFFCLQLNLQPSTTKVCTFIFLFNQKSKCFYLFFSFYVLQSFCFAQQLEKVMILLSYYVINLNI